jgi:uncharacterized protein (DUF1015 family)
MADIKPFKGIVYNKNLVNIKEVVSPPYDIISSKEKKLLAKQSPYNIVHLILKHDKNWPYTATTYFNNWLERKILLPDTQQAIYPYYMEYTFNGKRKLQRGFIARIKIKSYDKGVILPHEKTFSKIIYERLQLLKATKTHFSQVYGLYNDPEDKICSFLSLVTSKLLPFVDVKIDNVSHLVWRVTDKDMIKAIQAFMEGKKIIIADGHHRYRTALAYQEEMKQKFPYASSDLPYNYTSMYLSNLKDKSLAILPIHRVIHKNSLFSFSLESFIKTLRKLFEIELHKKEDFFWLRLRELSKAHTVIGFYCHEVLKNFYILILKETNWSKDLPSVLRKIDVIVLTRLILKEILNFSEEQINKKDFISYINSGQEAISLVQKGRGGLAFFLNPIKPKHLEEVVHSSYLMPRKSTYFYPKLLSGLVIDSLKF